MFSSQHENINHSSNWIISLKQSSVLPLVLPFGAIVKSRDQTLLNVVMCTCVFRQRPQIIQRPSCFTYLQPLAESDSFRLLDRTRMLRESITSFNWEQQSDASSFLWGGLLWFLCVRSSDSIVSVVTVSCRASHLRNFNERVKLKRSFPAGVWFDFYTPPKILFTVYLTKPTVMPCAF